MARVGIIALIAGAGIVSVIPMIWIVAVILIEGIEGIAKIPTKTVGRCLDPNTARKWNPPL